MYVESYTSSDGFYYPEYKKIKIGKRVFPYQYKGGETIMNLEGVKFAGKGCNFPYLAYMYLQYISYSDEKTRDKDRKVYVKYDTDYEAEGLNALTVAGMRRKTKLSDKTASKHIEYLKEHNFLSTETFEDKYGTYHKLYSLDANVYTYVTFNFDSRDLICGMASLKTKLIQLLIFYKFNSFGRGYYYGNYDTIATEMGIARDVLALYNEALVKMKLLKIEKVLLSNGKYSNRYYVLV